MISPLILLASFLYSQNAPLSFYSVDIISNQNGYSLNASIGSPSKIINLEINLDNNYLWLSPSGYNKDTSLTASKENVKDVAIEIVYRVPANVIIDTVAIGGIVLKQFPFYNGLSNSITNTIGLANNSNDKRFGLINQLKERGYVSRGVFGINKMKLYFGGFPNEDSLEMIGKCKVENEYNRYNWGCGLSQIKIVSKGTKLVFMNPYYTVFQTNTNDIFVPANYYDSIIDGILDPYFSTSSCMTGLIAGDETIHCDCKKLNDFPLIIFNFYGVDIQFDKSMLFEPDNDLCRFKMIKSYNKDYIFYWVFGTSIFKNYSLLFNSDDNTISFYNTFSYEDEKNNRMMNPLCMGNVVIVLIGTVLLLVSKYYMINKQYVYK